MTGRGPTELAAYETEHIVHTLEQIVRGYICGSSNTKWSNYIFSYNQIAGRETVKAYFYRFEFQQRGTVHLHLLVWLNNLSKVQHQHIRADIPTTNPKLSYLVHKLQTSDKPSHSLNLQNEESFFQEKDGKIIHHLKHPAKEFALNLRAYIQTILPTLKCSMDYQTTDGVAMLLRYVTSYVTKWHDASQIDSLYSYKVTGYEAAVKHLMTNQPAEPEMWFELSNRKVAWTRSRSQTVQNDKVANAYWKRSKTYEDFNLISWLRAVDHTKTKPKPYTVGTTLVGTKLLSFFNQEHFFQYVLLNLPHRNLNELQHPEHDSLPDNLQWYAQAVFIFQISGPIHRI
jgi:hypothetical protein